ncbi:hypothetical protein M3Y97_00607200 [Aphelenchoides bicaudatus]|nr:hypothetical protein M3Y97_00607200 [Aphelenchoides bicaudatus]
MGHILSSITPVEQKPKITHVIFDLDGTLIDSEVCGSVLHIECLKKFGRQYDPENKRTPVGITHIEEIRAIIKLYELNVTEKGVLGCKLNFLKALYLLFRSFLGAARLIQHLHHHKIPMAICTNSTRPHFDVKTKKFSSWLQKIPLKVMAGSDPETKNPKPFPEPFLVTMNRFAEKPESPQNVLVFEDSLTGVVSALKAGVNVVMIPQKYFDDSGTHKQIEEIRPKLAALLRNMNEFQPEKFGLPSFN